MEEKNGNEVTEERQRCCCPVDVCENAGIRIIRSALNFEDVLAELVRGNSEIVECAVRGGNLTIEAGTRSTADLLEMVCCIEEKLIRKLELGVCMLDCDGCE